MKKMIKIAFVAAFVAIAGYGVYTNQKSETLSDLTLANVEALAGGESGGYYCCSPYSYECYRIVGGGIWTSDTFVCSYVPSKFTSQKDSLREGGQVIWDI